METKQIFKKTPFTTDIWLNQKKARLAIDPQFKVFSYNVCLVIDHTLESISSQCKKARLAIDPLTVFSYKARLVIDHTLGSLSSHSKVTRRVWSRQLSRYLSVGVCKWKAVYDGKVELNSIFSVALVVHIDISNFVPSHF